jgi:hypothetical protein
MSGRYWCWSNKRRERERERDIANGKYRVTANLLTSTVLSQCVSPNLDLWWLVLEICIQKVPVRISLAGRVCLLRFSVIFLNSFRYFRDSTLIYQSCLKCS